MLGVRPPKPEMPRSVTADNINPDVFIKAVNSLRSSFPKFSEDWIQKSKDRILDVEYIGQEKGADIFHVKRNVKFDGERSSVRGSNWNYRKVNLRSVNHWCSCFYGPWGQKRERDLCSHIGAALLYRWYFRILTQG